jgi:hypothetical protein
MKATLGRTMLTIGLLAMVAACSSEAAVIVTEDGKRIDFTIADDQAVAVRTSAGLQTTRLSDIVWMVGKDESGSA